MTSRGCMPHHSPKRMHGRKSHRNPCAGSLAGCCSLTPGAPKTTPGCEVSIPGTKLAAPRTHWHHLSPSIKAYWVCQAVTRAASRAVRRCLLVDWLVWGARNGIFHSVRCKTGEESPSSSHRTKKLHWILWMTKMREEMTHWWVIRWALFLQRSSPRQKSAEFHWRSSWRISMSLDVILRNTVSLC